MKIIRDLTPLYLHLILFIKFYRPHSTIQIMSLFHITYSPHLPVIMPYNAPNYPVTQPQTSPVYSVTMS